MTVHGAPAAGVDAARLADGSRVADALTAMGANGIRALGHLRDARQKLAEPERWSQPMESVLASCRSALDSLLKEAGEAFEGPRDAQDQINREVEALLKPPSGRTGPLEKLHAALDAAADVPDVLEPRAGVGAGVQRLIRMPADRLPDPVDPRPEYDAERELLAAVARLDNLPTGPEEQRELVAVLRRLRQARRDSGAAARAAQPDVLAGLREAFAYRVREQQDGGAFRRRQLAHLVQERTGMVPGEGEQEAFAAWSRFYRETSGVLHGGSGDGEEAVRTLFADLVAHVEQLVLDLPDLAPLLVALVRAEAPTAEDARAVAAFQLPGAVRYFFTNAVSPGWMDLVSAKRLLPEATRWPAQPYLERVADADPQRALAWLTANKGAFAGAEEPVLLGLLQVTRRIGGPATGLVRDLLATDDALRDLRWRSMLAVWLADIPVSGRDLAWVEVAGRVLLHAVEYSAGQRWELQQQLADLRKAAYDVGGPGDTAVVGAVRRVSVAVAAAALASELELGDLDVADDLRQTVTAHDFGPAASRIAVRSLLDLARIEADHAVPLAYRTARWADLPGPARWSDRIMAAHLLETPPLDDTETVQVWLPAARDVLSRLGAFEQIGTDAVDLVAAALDRCPTADRPDLENLLSRALGPAPDSAVLAAGRLALAAWPAAPAPAGWSTAWALSPVLPAAVLAPWQDVVDAVAQLLGPAPRRPLPRIRISPYLDSLTATTQDLKAVTAARGAPAAAADLLARLRSGALSADYARIVAGHLVAADPHAWSVDITAVNTALEEPVLQHGYLAALHAPLTGDPCPIADPSRAWRALTAELWKLTSDPGVGDQAQLTLCLIAQQAWTRSIDLGPIEQPVAQWLTAFVTAWTAPASTPSADPLKAAHSTVGGTALDALIRWGTARAQAPAELTTGAARTLGNILEAGTDDRALAVVGHHLPNLLKAAPAWVEEHREQLFGLQRPYCPALFAIASRQGADGETIELVRHLDADRLADRLRQDAGIGRAMWEACAGLLLVDPHALGGMRPFLDRLATGDGGPAAVSRLLGAAERILPHTATAADMPFFDRAVALWREVLDLDLPADSGHLYGAGKFVYAQAFDNAVWLELTALTVARTAAISNPDAVARRAARHPDSQDAHRILAALVTLYDGTTPTTLALFRREEIKREAIGLWTCAPDTPARKALGTALARHANYLEAAL
ncbi:hypothetical protein ACFVT9_29195 [Kitasatospora cineracea]|uniref:hypothetical protein n=1 Tax=Kitasatospora cineracea TaxID=88074 RepID=UPI0036D97200